MIIHRLQAGRRTLSLIVCLICINVFISNQVESFSGHQKEKLETFTAPEEHSSKQSSKESIPANHKVEYEDSTDSTRQQLGTRRQSRQYDGTMSSSSTIGNYAAGASEAGAYVGQLPTSSNYATPGYNVAGSNYVNDPNNGYHSNYHDLLAVARGYTPTPSVFGYHHLTNSNLPPPPSYSPVSPHGPVFPTSPSQLPNFSSSMFPLMGKGFDVSEIVCTAIAVAIGAVIVGAPFILIYLFIMNQMNGGQGAIGPNGGSISLTGPNSSTTVSGRKKRHTSLPEALFKQLGPLVNNEQVAQTFKLFLNSLAKYQ